MKPTDTDKSEVQRVALLSVIAAGPALAISFVLWWSMWQDVPQNELGAGLARCIVPYIGAAFACAALSAIAPHVSKEDADAAQLWLLAATVAGAAFALAALQSPLLAALFVGGAFGASHGLRFVRDRSPAHVFKVR